MSAEKYNEALDSPTRLLSLTDETFDIEVMVQGATIKRSLLEDLQVSADGDDLNLWLTRQPAKTAFWRIWSGRAQTAMENAKKRYEKAFGKARLAARAADKERMIKDMAEWGKLPAGVRNQQPKPQSATVDELNAEAEQDVTVEAAWREYMHARDVQLVLDAGFKAIEALRSTLISLAANLRSEMGSYSNKVGRNDGSEHLKLAQEREKLLNEAKAAMPAKEEGAGCSGGGCEPAGALLEVVEIVVEVPEEEPLRPPDDTDIEDEMEEINGEDDIIVTGPHAGLVEALIQDKLSKLESPSDEKNEDEKVLAEVGRQDSSSKTQ